jgi:hypothetical protein
MAVKGVVSGAHPYAAMGLAVLRCAKHGHTSVCKGTNEEQLPLFSHQQRKEFEQEATEKTEKEGKSCACARPLVLPPSVNSVSSC